MHSGGGGTAEASEAAEGAAEGAAAAGTGLALPLALLLTMLALLAALPSSQRWWAHRRRLLRLGERLPGPKGLPLLGNALSLLGPNEDVFRTILRMTFEDSSVVRLWIGPRLLVFLIDPRDVELVLGSSEHLDKSDEYRFFEPWLGDGLLISTGSKWRRRRRLVAPAFHRLVLRSFAARLAAHGVALVERLRPHAQPGGGQPFDVHEALGAATARALLETAMGVTEDTDGTACHEYASAVIKLCEILHLRHTRLWLRPEWLFRLTSHGRLQTQLLRTVHGLTEKVIRRKKTEIKRNACSRTLEQEQELEQAPKSTPQDQADYLHGPKDDLDEQDENDIGQKRRLAFLDMLMESTDDGHVLTDDEIKEEVDTIMFEGHDTTAAAGSFFLTLMGLHQDIQERVWAEQRLLFGATTRAPSFADAERMAYLERCLLETLRLYPPVPVVARRLRTDLQLASRALVVPAGCTVVVGTYRVHRREDVFPRAAAFDPDRWLPEHPDSQQQRRHFYAFLAFSAGPRSCVGRKYAILKLKIFLSTIIRNYKIYSDIPEKDFKLTGDIILKRAEGFQIRLEPRSTQEVDISGLQSDSTL